MESLIFRVLYLFYTYYDKGSTKGIAYFSSVIALIMVITINVLTIAIVLGISDYIPLSNNPRWLNYILVFSFYILPLYIIIKTKFKKVDVINVQLKWAKNNCYFLLVSYILTSIILLIGAINSR